MEKQREKPKEKDKELIELQKELQRLRELKRQKELKALEERKALEAQEKEQIQKSEEYHPQEPSTEAETEDDVENRLNKISDFITHSLGDIDDQTYAEHSGAIESELQRLEKEIIGEAGLIEKELSPYEKIVEAYPWLEEKRYEFMYTIPHHKKNLNDYQSWRKEWSKVFFDYARYAILHIIYIKQIAAEKPFSKFEDRQKAIKEIADELVTQGIAKFLTKKQEILRVYWKSLDSWADEIYNWAYDLGKLDPIMLFEIRDAKLEFSTLPKEDLEEIFNILARNQKAKVLKLEEGQIALKIKLE
ncbi:MAG: hypothetical protein ACFFBP_14635 [Promethearchaeota archaeon]